MTLRILVSLASICTYLMWRREVRKENERRALQQRLDDAIRGGK